MAKPSTRRGLHRVIDAALVVFALGWLGFIAADAPHDPVILAFAVPSLLVPAAVLAAIELRPLSRLLGLRGRSLLGRAQQPSAMVPDAELDGRVART